MLTVLAPFRGVSTPVVLILDALPVLAVVASGLGLRRIRGTWAYGRLWWLFPRTDGGDDGSPPTTSSPVCNSACPTDVPSGLEAGVALPIIALVAALVLANWIAVAYLRQRRSRVHLLLASIGVDCAHVPRADRSKLLARKKLAREIRLKESINPWVSLLPAGLFALLCFWSE